MFGRLLVEIKGEGFLMSRIKGMTREEAIHIFENSRLVSEYFTPEAMTATYVMALAALRGPTREMVERVWFKEPYTRLGAWNRDDGATVYSAKNTCMSCGCETPIGNFCHNCGAALTDEAVDMMLEKLEEIENA